MGDPNERGNKVKVDLAFIEFDSLETSLQIGI